MFQAGALDFDGADAVAGDLDDLVGAAAEPDVAILIDVRRVAGVVDAGNLAPSSRGRSAPARPTGRRSDPGNGRLSTMMPFSPAAHGLPSVDTTAASMPGSGIAADPGLIGSMPSPYGLPNTGPPVSVCHM